MKIVTILLFLAFSCSARCQGLKNTEWIIIKAERKDGSKIVDKNSTDANSFKYYFREDSVYIALGQQYDFTQAYSINHDTLSIGKLINYTIDSASNVFLYLSQIPKDNLPEDKFNRYVFINSDYLFDYLRTKGRVDISADSVVVCDDYLCPTFLGDLALFIYQKFSYSFNNKSLKGSFLISSDGNITDVSIDSTNKITKKQTRLLAKTIYSTQGHWVIPPTPIPLKFKINFFLNFFASYKSSPKTIRFESFIFFSNNHIPRLAGQELENANRFFNNGIKFLNKGEFESAVTQFKKCTDIDSTNTDAYYSLAYCYQKLGNKELTC